MRILPPVIEETVQQASYAQYSRQAVRNIYEATVIRLEQLKLHRERMMCWIEMEHDLYQLLKYGERLGRVDSNMEKLDAKIRELKAELIKRRLRAMA